MEIKADLTDDDVAFLDALTEQLGTGDRSFMVHAAIGRLKEEVAVNGLVFFTGDGYQQAGDAWRHWLLSSPD